MADKTKIWGASPWWIFSWGGRAGASPHLHSRILVPPRLTRNLLLILITPREWIGRNIRQIGLSYIFYLHIPVTESQAHFLYPYFFICFRDSWGCSAPLGPHSGLQTWVLRRALLERRGEVHRRVRGLSCSRHRVKWYPFPTLPSLLPAAFHFKCQHAPCLALCLALRGWQHHLTFIAALQWARHGAVCLWGQAFAFSFLCF